MNRLLIILAGTKKTDACAPVFFCKQEFSSFRFLFVFLFSPIGQNHA